MNTTKFMYQRRIVNKMTIKAEVIAIASAEFENETS